MTLRARIWSLLRLARLTGPRGLAVATLASLLGTTPETILDAAMADLTECGAYHDPALYCRPSPAGPTLTPRRYPQ